MSSQRIIPYAKKINLMQTARPIRSFVHRQKKLSESQLRAFNALSAQKTLLSEPLDFKKLFQREASTILEVGFGTGDSLLQQAAQYTDTNYLGIEVYRPGIAKLLTQIEKLQLRNIKVIYADANEILVQNIPNHSLDLIQIFFPDPWPKTRHHKRRLIQPSFINLLHSKLKLNGKLHLVTDWQNYAHHMLTVMESSNNWINLAGKNQFTPRPLTRPYTKFEKRGQQLGHTTWDLIYSTL